MALAVQVDDLDTWRVWWPEVERDCAVLEAPRSVEASHCRVEPGLPGWTRELCLHPVRPLGSMRFSPPREALPGETMTGTASLGGRRTDNAIGKLATVNLQCSPKVAQYRRGKLALALYDPESVHNTTALDLLKNHRNAMQEHVDCVWTSANLQGRLVGRLWMPKECSVEKSSERHQRTAILAHHVERAERRPPQGFLGVLHAIPAEERLTE